jgi:PAS domain S-box-containing protein
VRPVRALGGGFAAALVAILGVVLLAYFMLSGLTDRWTEMSTVIAKRDQVLQRSSVHLGYAALYFQKYQHDGGFNADRFDGEIELLAQQLDAYAATGALTEEERRLLFRAKDYVGFYRHDMGRLVSLRNGGADRTTLEFAIQAENDKTLALVIRKLSDINSRRTEGATADIDRQFRNTRAGLLLAALAAAAGVLLVWTMASRAIVRYDHERNHAMDSLQVEIGDRKRAEAALRDTARMLESLIANLPGAIFRLRYLADGTKQSLFYDGVLARPHRHTSPSGLSYEEFRQQFHPDDHHLLFDEVPRRLRELGESEHTFRLLLPGGGVVWHRARERVVARTGDEMITEGITLDVTAEMLARLALQESERHYRDLVEALPVGVFEDEPGSGCVYASDFWTHLTGLSREDILGTGWVRTLHPDDLPRVVEEWSRCTTAGLPFQYEYRLRHLDTGAETWVLGLALPRFSADGRLEGYIGSVTDINDRKKAEQALRDTTRMLETLVGNLPGNAFRLQYLPSGLKRLLFLDGGLVRRVPGERERLLGLSPEKYLETFPLESRPLLFEDIPRQLRETGFSEQAFCRSVSGGVPQWFRSWERVVERDGDAMVTEGLVIDVTEEMEAKRSLERVNRILRTLGQANEALVRAADEAELFAAMCRVIVETGGYRMAWVGAAGPDQGEEVRPVAHAGHDQGFLSQGHRGWSELAAIRSGQPQADPDIARHPAGAPWRAAALERQYRSSIALPLRTDDGFFGILAIYAIEPQAFGADEAALFVDLANDLAYGISAMRERRRRAEMEHILAQAQKMEALGQLAGGVAHDFNNLLGAILGFASFIIEDAGDNDPAAYYARRIVAAGERGKTLVAQILSYARKGEIKRERVVLGQLLAEIHTLAGASVPSTTRLVIEDEMPGAVVDGDADGLTRMLLNLCINAHDALAGQPGTLSLRIRATTPPPRLPARATGEAAQAITVWEGEDGAAHAVSGVFDPAIPHVSLVVSDTGCGMEARLLETVFSPFFTTKGKGVGTGLGLAAVHGAVLTHGGALAVESRRGVGTSFEVILPLAEGPAAEPPAEPALPPPPALACRVLLVDDDRDFGDMLLAGLERRGVEVSPCCEPLTALAGVSEHPGAWDVLITDQTMPDMTGLNLIKAVKQIQPALPCILCTGYAEDHLDEVVLQDAGVFAVLHKPVDLDHLMATVTRAIGETAA